MEKRNEHDNMVTALMEEKSLAALVYLIDAGRELEFAAGENTYFISKDKAAKYVSLWKGQAEQSFDHMYDLIEHGKVEGMPFFAAWKESEISTLF
ncbi:MAG: hypothetical protein IJY52_08000 [Anaerotignum sp.]|nr:hypothetical protein [Anaerotignum sp.]